MAIKSLHKIMGTISFNELPEAITELLERVSSIEKLLKGEQKTTVDEHGLLTIREAGQVLNLSVNTMYKLAQNRIVPYSKKGKRLYFVKQELLEWVKSGKKKTDAELRSEAETGIINANKTRRKS